MSFLSLDWYLVVWDR